MALGMVAWVCSVVEGARQIESEWEREREREALWVFNGRKVKLKVHVLSRMMRKRKWREHNY